MRTTSPLAEIGRRGPLLCLISHRGLRSDLSPVEVLSRAAAAGFPLVQVREKDMDDRALCRLLAEVVAATAPHGTSVLVNGRFDVALAAGAHGVHLPESGLPVEAVRRLAPPGFLIGASTHSLERALAAESGGADYITFGPVYPTPSKAAYGPPRGVRELADVCRALAVPVLALGGVTADRLVEVLEAGAGGAGLISAVYTADDVTAAARSFVRSGTPAGMGD